MINLFKADRIIVAFDGKEESKKALRKAIDLSKRLGSQLTVAHVHEPRQVRTEAAAKDQLPERHTFTAASRPHPGSPAIQTWPVNP